MIHVSEAVARQVACTGLRVPVYITVAAYQPPRASHYSSVLRWFCRPHFIFIWD